jgi:hypothetical protein
LHVPAELRVEILLVEAGRREESAQLLAELRRRVPDRSDVGEVRAVAIELRVRGAALDPHDEQDDDEDRERDQPDEAKERRQVARRSEARPAATPPARRRLGLEALGLLPRGRVLLVEEVEIENVVVARTHAAASGMLDDP